MTHSKILVQFLTLLFLSNTIVNAECIYEPLSKRPDSLPNVNIRPQYNNILEAGDYLCYENYKFGITEEGDVCLTENVEVLWCAGIENADEVAMRLNGNLVVRDDDGDKIWVSRTQNNVGAELRLDANGLGIYIDGNPVIMLWIPAP